MFTQEFEGAYGLKFQLNVLSKLKDFSRSQAVTYTAKVVLSRKRFKLQSTDVVNTFRQYDAIYQLSNISNSDDLEGQC